ncbi:MAG: substrate-binding domain-containing protein, partial [Caldilinea sp.]|nr:substrate-binding domain-containing protein [Caldilinea sp.]
GLIVSPRTSEGVAPVIQQVIDAGIPVVTIDRSAEGVNGLLAHVGANNVIGGEAQGQAILSLFPDGAKIIELLGTPGASPAIDRSAGLHNIIDPAGNIEVVCQQTGEFKRDKGLTVTENCLSSNPDAQAIVAANDDMALGAIEAVKAAGLSIPILGFDALPEAIQAVNEGTLYGSVEQFPGGQSRTALNTIMDFIVDGTAPESDVVLLSPKLVSKDNLMEAERIGEVPGMEAAAAPEAAAPAEQLTIAFSVPAMSFPFFVHMEKQVRDEAAKIGNIEIVTLDGQDDTTKQVADLEGVIAQGYDGLIVSPRTSEGVAPVIQQVIDAGIPVVTIDRSAEGVTGLLAHVGANNVIGGEAQGEAILSLFPDGAKIIELLGTPGASPAIDRSAGLHNVIDPAGNIEVVCQQTGNFNRNDGLTVTENCLTANPDVQAIVAANDDMALGAVEAASAAGVSVPIIGFDALPEAIQAVNEGTLYGSVEQFPGGQSRTALNTIMDFIVDGTAPASDVVLLSPKLVSKDNLMEAERIGEVPGMEAAAAPEAAAP